MLFHPVLTSWISLCCAVVSASDLYFETQPCLFLQGSHCCHRIGSVGTNCYFYFSSVTRLAKRQQSVRELPSSLITAFTFNDTSTNVIFSSDFEEQRPKQSRQQTYQTGIVIYIIQVGEMGLRWQGAFRVELVNHLLKTFTPSTMESSLMSLTSV